MGERTQTDRQFELTVPKDAGTLLLISFDYREELGKPFVLRVRCTPEETGAKPELALRKTATLRINMGENRMRFLSGEVAKVSQPADTRGPRVYELTIVPKLWMLRHRTDCRIFQEMKVPDIIKDVLERAKVPAPADNLKGSYRKWEYCVQYRESDLNFVTRLMEQEGISFFHNHEDGRHELVLSDAPASHEPMEPFEELPYFPPDEQVGPIAMESWERLSRTDTGKVSLLDFDFIAPTKDLKAEEAVNSDHVLEGWEVFDYPGEYSEPGDGTAYAKVRSQEVRASHEFYRGVTACRGVRVGTKFKLTDSEGWLRSEHAIEYLVTSVAMTGESTSYASGGGAGGSAGGGGGGGGDTFTCKLSAIDAKVNFRPERSTPKPLIAGVQTAIVTGPAGEEIHTDEHGRVKLHFHWDRHGKKDDTSSCWVRVSQAVAGAGYGTMILPRVGHEVIVQFIEGDPDRPIVVGRVYNGDNKPPYALPDNKKTSGNKSKTYKGSGHNEVSCDDTPGKEKLTLHAQYDMSVDVLHDQTNHIKNNRTTTVDVDDAETVKGKQDLNVDGARTTHVKGEEKVTIDSKRTETITGGGEAVTITGDTKHDITGNFTRSVSADIKTSAVNISTDASAKWTTDAKSEAAVSSMKIKLDGSTGIELTCGGASIKMEPAKITLSLGANSVTIDPSGVSIMGTMVKLN